MIRYALTPAMAVCSLFCLSVAMAEQPSGALVHDAVLLTGTLELTESSGLAFSARDHHCVWTHNDSGSAAKLYAFDVRTGKQTGECRLTGADAVDWESITTAGTDLRELIVSDSGDNDRRRDHISLYRFDEPDPHSVTQLAATDYQTLQVKFSDGAIDCEAVWYDAPDSSVILLGKSWLPFAGAYRVPDRAWIDDNTRPSTPESSPENRESSDTFTAAKIATLALAMATGADCDPTTGDIWIASYFQAFCFRRGTHTTLQSQLTDTPVATQMPAWRQVEAIAIDHQSQVWITSEGNPAKLGRLR